MKHDHSFHTLFVKHEKILSSHWMKDITGVHTFGTSCFVVSPCHRLMINPRGQLAALMMMSVMGYWWEQINLVSALKQIPEQVLAPPQLR